MFKVTGCDDGPGGIPAFECVAVRGQDGKIRQPFEQLV